MKNEQNPVRQGKKLLFNFQDIKRYLEKESIRKRSPKVPETWGCSSAGRAPALHAGGQEFDPPHLHQRDEEGRTPDITN